MALHPTLDEESFVSLLRQNYPELKSSEYAYSYAPGGGGNVQALTAWTYPSAPKPTDEELNRMYFPYAQRKKRSEFSKAAVTEMQGQFPSVAFEYQLWVVVLELLSNSSSFDMNAIRNTKDKLYRAMSAVAAMTYDGDGLDDLMSLAWEDL